MTVNPFAESIPDVFSPNGKKSTIIGKKRAGALLTGPELTAYKLFKTFSPTNRSLMFSQVHLLQLFEVKEDLLKEEFKKLGMPEDQQFSTTGNINDAWNRGMGWKSIDFIFCDKTTGNVKGGIEIDDPSHSNSSRAASDSIKNVLFASAGMPLLRLTNADIAELNKTPWHQIEGLLEKKLVGALAKWKQISASL